MNRSAGVIRRVNECRHGGTGEELERNITGMKKMSDTVTAE